MRLAEIQTRAVPSVDTAFPLDRHYRPARVSGARHSLTYPQLLQIALDKLPKCCAAKRASSVILQLWAVKQLRVSTGWHSLAKYGRAQLGRITLASAGGVDESS